jgi:hypothetical protein
MMRLSLGFALAVTLAILVGLGELNACKACAHEISGDIREFVHTMRR